MLAIFGFYFFFLPRSALWKKILWWHWFETGKGQLIRSLVLQGGTVVSRSTVLPKSSRKPNKPCLIKCKGGDHLPMCWAMKRQWKWCVWNYWKACRLVRWNNQTSSWRPRPLRQVVKLCHAWKILHVHWISLESCIERQVKPFEVRSWKVSFGSAFQWFSWHWSHDLERSCLTPENAALFCRKAVEAFKILNMVSWPMATAA